MLYPLSYGGWPGKVSTSWAVLSFPATVVGVRPLLTSVLAMILIALPVGCVSRPDPGPAVLRDSAPPWDAPRDGVAYIEAAGLPEQPLDTDSDPWILDLAVTVDGREVEVPAYIGVDRLRAVQAPVHTHAPGGEIWLEGEGNREVTLGEFFTLWGVRLDSDCVGGACGDLVVTADGEPVADPPSLVLRGLERVVVSG